MIQVVTLGERGWGWKRKEMSKCYDNFTHADLIFGSEGGVAVIAVMLVGLQDSTSPDCSNL